MIGRLPVEWKQPCRDGFGMGGLQGWVHQEGGGLPWFPSDDYWMSQALLAAMAQPGRATPNPQVGCVLVNEKEQKMITSGTTEAYGGLHAERVAISRVRDASALVGATAYLTLEPCSHTGKQPPCVDALIRIGLRRCVIAVEDPFTQGAGRGINRLRAAGIQVDVGVLGLECAAWHLPFLKWAVQSKERMQPVFFAKWAQTLDGHLADDEGGSKWITGPQARMHGHWLRQLYCAVMVGAGTVLADFPRLSVRDTPVICRQPLKIVFDPQCRLMAGGSEVISRLRATTFGQGQVIWLVAPEHWEKAAKGPLGADHVLVLSLDPQNPIGGISSTLSQSEVAAFWGKPLGAIFVEGGPKLLDVMMRQGLIQGGHVFMAPGYLGGRQNRIFSPPPEGRGHLCNAMPRFQWVSRSHLGGDLLMEFVC